MGDEKEETEERKNERKKGYFPGNKRKGKEKVERGEMEELRQRRKI